MADNTFTQALKNVEPEISPTPNSSSDIDSGAPHLTDSGNSSRFVKRHGHEVKFVHAWGKFLLWNGNNWAKDDSGKIYELAIKTALSIYTEAANQADYPEQKKIVDHARNSQAKTRLDAMLGLVKHQVAISASQLDESPYLFNCSNGTINLKTGELLPPNPSHLLTKISPVEFNPNTQCPIWERFLFEVFNGDKEMVGFLQRVIGYALTGDTSEQCLFFLYGIGRNGKSTLIETLMVLLGDYSTKAEMRAFMEKNGASVNNDIACLAGSRLVCAVESGRNQRINESLVKEIVGQDLVTARYLYQEFFSFKPQFKLFLAGNSKPVIKGNDEGIWRRIRLLPFEVVIPKEKVDKKLPEKLLNELPGILNWAVRGCLDWQKNGLREPKIVVDATSCYREEMDLLADFFSSEVIEEAFSEGEKGQTKVSVAEIYKRYTAWCEVSSVDPVKRRTFGIMMNERGFTSKPVFYQGRKQRVYNGIGLREQTRDGAPPDCHGTEGTELTLDSGNFPLGNLAYRKKAETSVPSVPKENKNDDNPLMEGIL
jgi:putative DNA primase/helicase